MDSKLSTFPEVTEVGIFDKIPLLASGTNKLVTVGFLTQNMPNIGNKGITKNAITLPTSVALPLTGTLINLPYSALPYTMGAGVPGQCVVIVSNGINTLQVSGKTMTFPVDGSVTLYYISTKWVVTANVGCTVV